MTRRDLACPNCGNEIIDEGLDLVVCPACNIRFERHAQPSPALGLKGPAIALICTAAFGFFGNCVTWMAASVMRDMPQQIERPAGMDDDTWRSYQRGADAAPLFDACITVLPMIFIYPLVLIGGIQMQKRRNYTVCVLAAIAAMLPCGLACIVGLPAGIFALSVLLDKEVRDSFE